MNIFLINNSKNTHIIVNMQISRQCFCQHLRENVEWDIWTTLSANSPIWLVEYAKFKQPKMLFNIFETGRVNLVCGICQIQTTKDVYPFLEGCVPYSDIDYWWWWWYSIKVFLLHMYVEDATNGWRGMLRSITQSVTTLLPPNPYLYYIYCVDIV